MMTLGNPKSDMVLGWKVKSLDYIRTIVENTPFLCLSARLVH